ncbi:redoxin domain-containing protein [Mucilaginibacter corticis]|uniref:Redoxin domain-containing protein n=1 Tax=Mucilaginibacter corticis TaxID=2597670 RepID=A0A556MIL9_9SPHI|nr:redoxin domain-containing protein [Mucilaginibacter corticis]TSJ39738.1 redoxin domain-containing protein [Mucilaginibacter corticis]
MKGFKLFILFVFISSAGFAQGAGSYRGVLKLPNGSEVPFNFEIKNNNAYFINGKEHFAASGLRKVNDSLFINFDQFDNELALKIEGKQLTGLLRKKDGSGHATSVTATYGDTYRFRDKGKKPAGDITGKYDVSFERAGESDENKVGLFKQEGNKLYATFLSISGDSRYLEGIVEGNSFYLSSFIGSGPAYYTGTFDNSGHVTGTANGRSFKALKNVNAALPDPYKLTYLKDGYTTFDFSLPDINGNNVSLKDDQFRNKVVIVTIGGTWCPNCMDEAAFMAPWYEKNKNRGLAIVGVQFERKMDQAYVHKAMENFKNRFGIGYTEVFGGLADKNAVAQAFPALNTFLSFPTILFIDKKGKVDQIYTGFTGPATGNYYQQFIEDFNEEIDKLLAEKFKRHG